MEKEVISPERRSQIMGAVKRKNTKPEIALRSLLYRSGYRFHLHRSDLTGTPDIVFPKVKGAIFVHGCFWHRHRGCKRATTPTQNREFWEDKFAGNIVRDNRKIEDLGAIGWRSLVVWECEILEHPEMTLANVAAFLEERRNDAV